MLKTLHNTVITRRRNPGSRIADARLAPFVEMTPAAVAAYAPLLPDPDVARALLTSGAALPEAAVAKLPVPAVLEAGRTDLLEAVLRAGADWSTCASELLACVVPPCEQTLGALRAALASTHARPSLGTALVARAGPWLQDLDAQVVLATCGTVPVARALAEHTGSHAKVAKAERDILGIHRTFGTSAGGSLPSAYGMPLREEDLSGCCAEVAGWLLRATDAGDPQDRADAFDALAELRPKLAKAFLPALKTKAPRTD